MDCARKNTCIIAKSYKKYKKLFTDLIGDYRDEMKTNRDQRDKLRQLIMETEDLKCSCQLMSIESKLSMEKLRHVIKRQTNEAKCLYELYIVEKGIALMLSQLLKSAYVREEKLNMVKDITKSAEAVAGIYDQDPFNPVLGRLDVMCKGLEEMEEKMKTITEEEEKKKETPPDEQVDEEEKGKMNDDPKNGTYSDNYRLKKLLEEKEREREKEKRERELLDKAAKKEEEDYGETRFFRSFMSDETQSPKKQSKGTSRSDYHASISSRDSSSIYDENRSIKKNISLAKDALLRQYSEREQMNETKKIIEEVERKLVSLEKQMDSEEKKNARKSLDDIANELLKKMSGINLVNFEEMSDMSPPEVYKRSESGSETLRSLVENISKAEVAMSLEKLEQRFTKELTDEKISEMQMEAWSMVKIQRDLRSDTSTSQSELYSVVVSDVSTGSSNLKGDKALETVPKDMNSPEDNVSLVELTKTISLSELRTADILDIVFEDEVILEIDPDYFAPMEIIVRSTKPFGARMSRKVSFVIEDDLEPTYSPSENVPSIDRIERFEKLMRRRRSSSLEGRLSSTSSDKETKIVDTKQFQTNTGYFCFLDEYTEASNLSEDDLGFYRIDPPLAEEEEGTQVMEIHTRASIMPTENNSRRSTVNKKKMAKEVRKSTKLVRKDAIRAATAINYKSPLSPPPSLRSRESPPFLEEARRKKKMKDDGQQGPSSASGN